MTFGMVPTAGPGDAALASPRLLAIARAALEEAHTLPEVARLIDQAEIVRVAARKAKLSRDAQNDWGEYRLDAERKAGALLKRLAETGERAQRASNGLTDGRPPTLVELGVADEPAKANTRAHRWRQLAAIPEASYEAFKAEVRADDEAVITQAAALAVARRLRPAKSHAQADAERRAAVQEAVDGAPVSAAPGGWPRYGVIERAEALNYLLRLARVGVRVHMAMTSPAFWMLRTYTNGDPRELGQERCPSEYVSGLAVVVDAIGAVLAPEGVLLLELGDTFASQPGRYRGDAERARGISEQAIRANGTAPDGRLFDVASKSLCLIPERVAVELALRRGWRVAARIAWVQEGHAPENVFDRPAQGWEHLYVLTRAEHCAWRTRTGVEGDPDDDVWRIRVGRGGAAAGHLAPFPDELVERALRHGCPERGTVLDPFAGSGTVRDVAHRMGRRFLGCDLLGEP
jgi:hypothetical protein